jgi:hypothetical protein
MFFDGGTAANANLVAVADTTIKLPVVVLSDRNNSYGVSTSYYIALDRSSSSLFAGRNDVIYVNNYQDKGHYFVTNNGGSKATRMTILSTGNVGIGTTSPSEKLHISGGTLVDGNFTASTVSATTYYNLPYSGTVTGSGSLTYIPKWTSSTGLGDSQITDNGTYVTIPSLTISTSGLWNPSPVDTNVGESETLYPLYVDINSSISQSLNEGFMNSGRKYLNDTFLTIINDSDHRAIKIFYSIRSDDDNYFRSGDIIANWNSLYSRFYQTEYGPTSNQPLPDTIDVPTVLYNGVNTELRIYVSGTYAGKCILKIKYVLL